MRDEVRHTPALRRRVFQATARIQAEPPPVPEEHAAAPAPRHYTAEQGARYLIRGQPPLPPEYAGNAVLDVKPEDAPAHMARLRAAEKPGDPSAYRPDLRGIANQHWGAASRAERRECASPGRAPITHRELVAEGTTVLLTRQYLDEADRLAGEIAVIDRGQVIATGTAAELKAKIGRQTLDVRPADPADLTPLCGPGSGRANQAGVIGGDDELSAVARTLHEQAADVGLGGGQADAQVGVLDGRDAGDRNGSSRLESRPRARTVTRNESGPGGTGISSSRSYKSPQVTTAKNRLNTPAGGLS